MKMNVPQSCALLLLTLSINLSAASPTQSHSRCPSHLEDQHLPHPTHCSKYYRCVYGKMVPKECPEKMLFNANIGNCDLYYNVDCPHDKEVPEDGDNITDREFTVDPKLMETTTAQEHSSTDKFVYLPHETDPSAYYRIENGARERLTCEPGTVFSFDLEICVKLEDT